MSAENVVINFVGKTDELKPVENALDNIIAQSGEVGQAWGKAASAMNNQTKTSTESTNKLAKSIDALATAAKSMDKAVIGGAYKDYLKQIQAQLGLTNKELIAYIQNARKAAQESIFTAQTDEEINQITLSIEAMNEQLKQLGAWEDEAGDKTQSLRSRIKEAKEELVAMAEAGLQGTPAFQALQEKAGELDDQMRDLNATVKGLGSDTKHIDGLISLAGGVAGGFAVAQGAAALFGSENEEVQKALLKVNAAMSILQGLQAIQNVLQKESAASLLFNTGARTAQTTAVVAETAAEVANVAATEAVVVAEGAQVVATEAATVAQTELNVAMSLNPIGLVIAGVVALVAAISIFSSSSRDAAVAQNTFNDAMKEATDYLDIDLKALEHTTSKHVALAKQRGASAVELTRIEGEAGNARLKIIDDARVATAKALNDEKVRNELSAEDYKKLLDKNLELDFKYQDERNALEVKSIEFRKTLADNELKSFIAFQEAKVLATRSGSIAEKNAQIASIRATRDAKDKLNPDLTPGEKAKNAAEDARAISDIQLQIYAYTLKSITSMDEANVANKKRQILQNQVDSIASIKAVTDAEIAAIRSRTSEQIKSNPNLSKGERAKIEAEANLQIAELRRQHETKLLEIKKAGINAQLILAQKGTQDEYDAKIQFIEASQQIDLSATELTEQQVSEIKAKYQKQRQDALRAFNEAQLQNQISYENAALDKFGITENQKLDITLSRLDKQRQLEISQAEGNTAKIAEINAKYDKQTIEAKKATIKAILDDNLRTLEVFTFKSAQANQRIVESQFASGDAKIKALEQLQKFEDDKFDLQHKALTKQVEDGLLTAHEFDVAYQDLLNKRSESEEKTQKQITEIYIKETEKRVAFYKAGFAILQKGLDAVLNTSAIKTALNEFQNVFATITESVGKLKAILDDPNISPAEKTQARLTAFKEEAAAVIQATQAVVNQIFADSAAARQQALNDQLALLEEQKQKELDNKNLTEQQKADIEEKYKQRERQEKIKAFNADKEAKKTQAVINGLLGITNAFATAPTIIAGVILAALVAASTAIQVAKISSTPVPRFKYGKQKGGYEGLGIVDDGGKFEPIWRKDGSIEIATGSPKDRLTYLHRDDMVFPSMEAMYKHFSFPQVPEFVHPTATNQSIDYDKLAEAVANKMAGIIPAPAQIHNAIDGDSLKQFMLSGNTKTEIKNKYFSMT
jgi:hypothetical protein